MVTKEQLLPTLRYWVDDYVKPKPDQQIVITADSDTNPVVFETVVELIRASGARVVVCEVAPQKVPEGAEPGSHIGQRNIEMEPPLFEARAKADRLVDLGGVPDHNPFMTKLDYEYSARRVSLSKGAKDPEFLLSPHASYPAALMAEIGRKTLEILRASKVCHVTHEWGTDLYYEVCPASFGPPNVSMPTSGWGKYRIGRPVIGCNPPLTCNGVVVSRYSKDIGGTFKNPVTFRFVDGWVEEVTGGEEAKRMLALIGDDRYNRRIQEVMMGLNPKATAYRKDGSITYDGSPGAGNVHVAIGREVGRFASSQHITITFMPKVTLYADQCLLIDKGRLTVLDDPDVRKFAKRYGDPDQLLKQIDL